MFVSTLLLIPWIIFNFKNSEKKFLGLNQTKKSFMILMFVEISYFSLLVLLLDNPDPNIAGRGDFAWTYMFIYEKAIFPVQFISESINGYWGDIIDRDYKFIYLLASIVIDYIVLWIIRPRSCS